MFCMNCGAPLSENAKFCTSCGASTAEVNAGGTASANAAPPTPTPAPVQSEQAAPVPPQPVYQQHYAPPQKNNNGLIAALVGALILAGGLAIYLLMSRGDTSAGTDIDADVNITSGSGNAGAAGNTALGNAPTGTTAGQPYNGPASGPAVGPEVVKYVSSDANIRNIATAQGSGSQVTGKLKRGAQVKGVMHQGLSGTTHWLKLSDGRGYVSAINLGDGPPAAEAPINTAQARRPVANATYCTVVTQSGNLRIRSGPNGRIIGGMPPGARFQAYGGDYDAAGTYWVQIQPVELRYPVGWVSADHVAC